MKERSGLPGSWVDTYQVWTFLQVAVSTGESKIVKLPRSAVLPGDNMFDVERTAEGCLWQETVLATVAGATPHLLRQLTHAGWCKV